MKRVEINEIIFKKLIDGVKHCVARDDSRRELKYIQIKVKSATITAYALDGYRAGRVEIGNTCPIEEEFICYIKPLTVKVSKRGINPVVVECVDEKTFVEVITEYGKLRYEFIAPQKEFIDLEKIYETARPHDRELGLTSRYVIEALRALNGVTTISGGRNVAVLEIKENNKEPFIISAKNDYITNEQLIIPVRLEG